VASFTVEPPAVVATTTAIFGAVMRGSRQEAGGLQRLTLTVTLWDVEEWLTLQSLVTSKYHVHEPLGGVPVVDVVIGPGEGALVIDGLGSTSAILTALDRSSYLPYLRSQGTAAFLITGSLL